ncbi:MAG: hypothetical protein DRP47_11415 [Candidatus Zixiibacteriota bacterium]|nr:hypothetical protein [Bacteroidales bacterium]RKX24412.1 MAG: hypothetical protein DRP47_11415 [candidate division Zixibacteria bacterium]
MNYNINNNDDIIKLFQSQVQGQNHDDPREVVSILLTETVRFRDKLKKETGEILTVADTRVALNILKHYLDTGSLPKDIRPRQKSLANVWIDRLSLFEK